MEKITAGFQDVSGFCAGYAAVVIRCQIFYRHGEGNADGFSGLEQTRLPERFQFQSRFSKCSLRRADIKLNRLFARPCSCIFHLDLYTDTCLPVFFFTGAAKRFQRKFRVRKPESKGI